MSAPHTFLASLKHAVRDRQAVTVGGGHFTYQELKKVLIEIEHKDALLRKCLKHVASNISMTSDGNEAEELYDAITKELQ